MNKVIYSVLAVSLFLNALLLPYWPKSRELSKLLVLRDSELQSQKEFYLEELSWAAENCENIVEVERVVTKTITKIREVPTLEKDSCDRLSPELNSLLDEAYEQLFPPAP